MTKKLPARFVPLVAGGVVLLFALISWFLVVSPQRSHASSLDGKIADARAELATAQVSAKTADPRADQARLRLAGTAMPDSPEMTNLIRELMAASAYGQVRLDSMRALALAPLSGYSAMPMDVKVTGKFPGIKRFLHRLETQAGATGNKVHARGRLFAIDSLDFAPGEANLPELTATVHLNAFVYGAVAPPTPAPTTDGSSGTASAAGRTN
jgi:hypothetical protein